MIVRDRLAVLAERERATAEAAPPTFEVNADGDGFSTDCFGGCGGTIYSPRRHLHPHSRLSKRRDRTSVAAGDKGDKMSTCPSGNEITAWLESFM